MYSLGLLKKSTHEHALTFLPFMWTRMRCFSHRIVQRQWVVSIWIRSMKLRVSFKHRHQRYLIAYELKLMWAQPLAWRTERLYGLSLEAIWTHFNTFIVLRRMSCGNIAIVMIEQQIPQGTRRNFIIWSSPGLSGKEVALFVLKICRRFGILSELVPVVAYLV